ncbi:hypothetical protein BDV97DRAFT_348902 [Delphinella strobiligena]|nr:hypothetical protein BDV97DRAFT_348902 [Delphinella strobiligena]
MGPRAAGLLSPMFQTSPKYPLSKQLAKIWKYDARRNPRAERASDTVDIVSPDLCDDILDYIGPSLEEHKGCDIIDIHPGPCLWSQKLHDFLKPRRHLLMEPEENYREPFIEPLLNLPGSNYRHTTLSGAHPRSYFESYEQIFNDDLLPKRDPLQPGDPKLRQPNKSLLVTGTLSRRYRSVRGKINSVHNANLLLNHMVQASQTNSLFHKYGLIRMLFWHPEDTKLTALPEMVVSRNGYGASMEVAADLVEVAGKDRFTVQDADQEKKRQLYRFRYPELDQASADRVLQRMETRGMHMPVHRQNTLHKKALQRKKNMSEVHRETRQLDPIYVAENVPLDEAISLHEKKFEEFSAIANKPAKTKSSLQFPYQYKFPAGAAATLTESDCSRLGPYMDLWGTQLALEGAISERKAKAADSIPIELEEQVRRMAGELRDLFMDKTSLLSAQKQGRAISLQNEVQAFHTNLLAHDRRPYEALMVRDEEFWPQFGMFLLDIQPRNVTLSDGLFSPLEANNALRTLVSTLWQLSASSVSIAMDRVGANAGNDLVPSVPDLTDASKGGRWSADDVSVRLLTREMIEQLTSVYLEWPFRPSTDKLPQQTFED